MVSKSACYPAEGIGAKNPNLLEEKNLWIKNKLFVNEKP